MGMEIWRLRNGKEEIRVVEWKEEKTKGTHQPPNHRPKPLASPPSGELTDGCGLGHFKTENSQKPANATTFVPTLI